jgi:nitrogen fixation/metabolism regulation signal transduction histidine kinase
LLENTEFGSIRVGVSRLLIRRDLDQSLGPVLLTMAGALAGASLVSMLLAQLLLRPIHVIRSGLTRLGQGEFGVMLSLPQQDEFGELGEFFNTVSTQLASQRRPDKPHQSVADSPRIVPKAISSCRYPYRW